VTCAFNREWVENEIAETRKALADLAEATKGTALPEAKDAEGAAEDDGTYGYHFTEKDPAIVEKLGIYELQHAIYLYHKMVDAKNPDTVATGKVMLKKVFDELDRRGMKGIRPGSIRE
jgi:hypothetical protein